MTANVGTLVPVDAQPAQIFKELCFKACLAPFKIGVFNSEDVDSFSLSGEKPVVEGGSRISHVQQSGGRGGKADADFL